MTAFTSIKARQIFDNHGNPTVEVDITVFDGTFARVVVPSGASTGIYEALEIRDGGSDYLGKGVSKDVDNMNTVISPASIGKDSTKQTVDFLEGTWRFRRAVRPMLPLSFYFMQPSLLLVDG
ncbi:unnamed protein product [Lathyrus sativus]|nr:unnamed protein product [Lathyrus sativus]